jgi:hypothetical protein
MVQAIAHELVIRAPPGQAHAIDQDGDHAIDLRVAGDLDLLLLVAGGIPDFDGDISHAL